MILCHSCAIVGKSWPERVWTRGATPIAYYTSNGCGSARLPMIKCLYTALSTTLDIIVRGIGNGAREPLNPVYARIYHPRTC